jgi:glucose-6-phosphate 1-dehydrogenase
MEAFNFVIFGYTSNLAQLKFIPALYDMEKKNVLASGTKIIGIGRKDIKVETYIKEVLSTPNRHHKHPTEEIISEKLINRTVYLQEDVESTNNKLYEILQNERGNTLYYLATLPSLYEGIFENLKKYGLNKDRDGWTKIMIEKPIGHNFETAKKLNDLLSDYFPEKRIFRVDHYLGKTALRKIFEEKNSNENIERIEASISEDFGIGKRGAYYDTVGALIDMGQNHLLQMLAAVCASSSKNKDREDVIRNLVPNPEKIIFGQYKGYLNEPNVSHGSKTDSYFALKTMLSEGRFKNVPVYLSSGKKLNKNEARMEIFYKDGKIKKYIIPAESEDLDPYERLIADAVNGDQTYFNSAGEIEASWKFIDKLSENKKDPFIYELGSFLCDGVSSKFTS